MRRILMLGLIALMTLVPAARAEEYQLPICTNDEFLKFFNMIVEYQILFDGPITNIDELLIVSRAQIENRKDNLAQLPFCSDAIAIQLLLIQLGGDSVALAALQLAALPDADNPYFQRLPGDQERIESIIPAMLSINRADALSPDERVLPSCTPEILDAIDDAVDVFLALYESIAEEPNPAQSIAAIDRLLSWREDDLSLLPECAESIELVQALSAAATDSASFLAFTNGGVTIARNPYPQLLSDSIVKVTEWRDARQVSAASQVVPSTSVYYGESQLPPCTRFRVSSAYDSLQPEYANLLERADTADSIAAILSYSEAHIEFRASSLSQLPNCAEAFYAGWWVEEVLSDRALRKALPYGARSSTAESFGDLALDNEAKAADSLSNMEITLEGERRPVVASAASIATACSDADFVLLFSYLVPEFWDFTNAALSVWRPQGVVDLIDNSYAFRQLLWANLPRCSDALEIGMIMRAIAADYVALLAMEIAGAPPHDIPYLPEIASGMHLFFERIGEFTSTCGSIDATVTIYYVVAENIANVRSCASTECSIVTTAHRGQSLDVVDDLSNWYEIWLPTCEPGYIAGFLVSQTAPDR